MAKPKKTKLPCDGCGKTPDSWEWRSVGEVCSDCKLLMEDGRNYRKMMLENSDLECFLMTWRDYSLPSFYIGGSSSNDCATEFKTLFFELLHDFSRPIKGEFPSGKRTLIEGSSSTEGVVLMNPILRDKLNRLYQLVREIADTARLNGKNEGTSFLVRMAKNEIGIEDFNKITTRKRSE